MMPAKLHELSEVYALDNGTIEQYQRDGHVLIRGLAAPAVIDTYQPLVQEEVKRLNQSLKPLSERDTYGKAFIQTMNLWETSETIRAFSFARRFAKVAAELMGVDGVRIYHDQALFKEPGGGHTPWHQDQIYWPLDTDKTITLWMPLVDIPQHVGSMTFVPGSHRNGYISKEEISDQSHRTLKAYIEQGGMPTVNYGALSAGDATFHAGWTLHSAPDNPTDQVREVFTVIYVADGARVLEPDSGARRSDLSRWLPGLEAGDAVASPLNPLLYHKTLEVAP